MPENDLQAQIEALRQEMAQKEAQYKAEIERLNNEATAYAQMIAQMTTQQAQAPATFQEAERTQPQPGLETDWTDPAQVRAWYEQELARREEAWRKYAQDVQQYLTHVMDQRAAYAVWAAQLMAADPELAKNPDLVKRLFQEAPKHGGDLTKAYQAIKQPLEEKAKLEKQIQDYKKQLETLKASAPVLGGTTRGPEPIRPKPEDTKTQAARHTTGTGRYREVLSKIDPSTLIKSDAELAKEEAASLQSAGF
jgi:chromosome segregation ATPase